MSSLSVRRALIWSRLDGMGSEYFALWNDEDGFQLRGTVTAALESRPMNVRYAVICDSSWRTRAVHVALRSAAPEQALHMTVEDGRWTVNGIDSPDLDGCLDVDLEITPGTNTLPIERLGLSIIEAADVSVAWVRFPSLSVTSARQRYERVDARTYRYTGAGNTAVVEVDDLGLVTRYAEWERVAQIDGLLEPTREDP